MGVNEQLMIVSGIKLKEDLYDFDKHENYDFEEVKEGEIGIIHDGMSGEYLIIGIVHFSSDRYGPIEMNKTYELSSPTDEQKEKTYRFCKEKFEIKIDKKDIKTYVFMHYS